jgi:hypothetical protein
MCVRSSALAILLVAWRSSARRASSACMPQPSSVTAMKSRPPARTSTRSRFAAASSAFSTSSFTTEAGRSTTSPAAIWSTSASGRARTRRPVRGGLGCSPDIPSPASPCITPTRRPSTDLRENAAEAANPLTRRRHTS